MTISNILNTFSAGKPHFLLINRGLICLSLNGLNQSDFVISTHDLSSALEYYMFFIAIRCIALNAKYNISLFF